MDELRKVKRELLGAIGDEHEALLQGVFDLLDMTLKRGDRLEKENATLKKRVMELEGRKPKPPSASNDTSTESYSLSAEEKRRRNKSRKKKADKSRKKAGRKRKDTKSECVRWEEIIAPGFRKSECDDCYDRIAWRIENGKAIRVGYKIFRPKFTNAPTVPGLLPHCEYGIEIHVLLAYLVYMIGMSIDKACEILAFFCELPIAKSQANAMLDQLGEHWQTDFDEIVERIVAAAVVYTDETSWHVGRCNTSLWSFTSAAECVMLFGCSKDRATLESILPPDKFNGTLVSDNAAVYDKEYTSQKCWAHLLRKAIKLALLATEEKKYQTFLKELLGLYHQAKQTTSARLGKQKRLEKVNEFEAKLCDLCHPHWEKLDENELQPTTDRIEKSFRNLINELMDLCAKEELFQFVLDPNIEPTNNLSERQLRNSTIARKLNRTNKTTNGARRQTNIVSILETLRRILTNFTFQTVIDHATAIPPPATA